jgi:hypothetical protein
LEDGRAVSAGAEWAGVVELACEKLASGLLWLGWAGDQAERELVVEELMEAVARLYDVMLELVLTSEKKRLGAEFVSTWKVTDAGPDGSC